MILIILLICCTNYFCYFLGYYFGYKSGAFQNVDRIINLTVKAINELNEKLSKDQQT